MAEFDFYKYVTENKATLGSRLSSKRLLKEEEEDQDPEIKDDWDQPEDDFDSSEYEKEPSKKDIKGADKEASADADKRTQLSALTAQKNKLIQKLKAGEITIDQYKQMIGSIPQQIKTLTADLSKLTDVDDEEEVLQEAEDLDSLAGAETNALTPGDYNSFFEKYDSTDINGPSTEQYIDDIIYDLSQLIKQQIPQQDQYAARIAVKKLWLSKISDWKRL